jgi:hypothetical protein
MSSPCRHLTSWQYAGLLHVGDVLVPGTSDLPSFRQARCAQHADRMLAWMYPADRRGLALLLGVLRVLPAPVVRWLFAAAARADRFPRPVANALRMADIGVKGSVMTLYYSDVGEGPSVFEVMGWDPTVAVHGDEAQESA